MAFARNGSMRVFATTLLILGLALAALPATAQTTGQTSFTLTAAQKGGDYIWVGEDGRENPTLTVPAGEPITVTARQGAEGGVPHNIKVGTQAPSATFEAADESVEYTFTAPTTGSVPYVCTIHPATMKGVVQVAGTAGNNQDGETGDNDSPGVGVFGALVALLGVALLVARRS